MADNTVSSLELMGNKVIKQSAILILLLALLQVRLLESCPKGGSLVLKVMFDGKF